MKRNYLYNSQCTIHNSQLRGKSLWDFKIYLLEIRLEFHPKLCIDNGALRIAIINIILRSEVEKY